MDDGQAWGGGGVQDLDAACGELRWLLPYLAGGLPPEVLACEPHLPHLLRSVYAQLVAVEAEVGRLRAGEHAWGAQHLGLLAIVRRDTAYLQGVLRLTHELRVPAGAVH